MKSDRRLHTRLEPSCLYPDDTELALLILGPRRAQLWPEIAMIEERHGFPRVDPLYGGRSWLDIVAFYERRRQRDTTSLAAVEPDETRGETFRPRGQRSRGGRA